MDHDLLINLRKYRTRENLNPIENFVTEAFGWLLKQNDSYSRFILNSIFPNAGVEFNNWKWSTQVNFGGVYPDMLVESEGKAVVFENKVWSSLSENQMEKYRIYASQQYNWIRTALITASKQQHTQDADGSLCWSDVHQFTIKWLESYDGADEFIFRSFVKLLEKEGLGPPAPISHESILSYLPAQPLSPALVNLVERSDPEAWHVAIDSVLPKKVNRYGRIGIELFGHSAANSWRPGVFVGFLLDGTDHRTRPISPEKGPDFSVIVDFGIAYHGVYSADIQYQSLVDRLGKELELDKRWELYNHLDDPDVHKPNLYHPIHIRRPMIDLFEGTRDSSDQDKALHVNATFVLDLLFKNGEIFEMREKDNQIAA